MKLSDRNTIEPNFEEMKIYILRNCYLTANTFSGTAIKMSSCVKYNSSMASLAV